MLNQIVVEISPQVKTVPLTRQNLLTQKLTIAIANKSTKEIIQVDGQKFSLIFKSGVSGNRSHYVIRTVKSETLTVDAVDKRQASLLKTLGKPIPTKIQSFIKPIESGVILEVELGISSIAASKVTPVAGWSNEVEAYVAKVCDELGWAYVSPRKAAFNARVNLLHGEIEDGIN